MTLSCPRLLLSLALAMVAAGQAQSLTNPPQPAHVRFAPHPYTSAMGALANYRSCGVHVRAAAFARLDAMFRESETAARAKGLGPLLDDLRRDYLALLAVSTMTACGGGPAAALTGARTAVRGFQAWVAAQPAAQ
jgi:hypothetical protein